MAKIKLDDAARQRLQDQLDELTELDEQIDALEQIGSLPPGMREITYSDFTR
jgi:transposase